MTTVAGAPPKQLLSRNIGWKQRQQATVGDVEASMTSHDKHQDCGPMGTSYPKQIRSAFRDLTVKDCLAPGWPYTKAAPTRAKKLFS
jgi:hypothetical protein